MLSLDYLVTGTGHGGTMYMAKLLSAAGVPCTHEWIFGLGSYNPYGIHGEMQRAESSWLAAPWLDSHRLLYRAKVIHVTRDPIRVIRSNIYANRINAYNRYAHFALGWEWPPKITTEYWMKFYVQWHHLIESQQREQVFRFKVEQGPEILKHLGLELHGKEPSRSTNRHTTDDTPGLTWDDLPRGYAYDDLCAMAEKYGYEHD